MQTQSPVVVLLSLALFACEEPPSIHSAATPSSPACRGRYSIRNLNGDLHAWYEFSINGQCFTDAVPLTQWESSSENWRKRATTCTPQPAFQPRTLVSANNFYSYRDGRIYLDLNSYTGVFRRLTLAEGKDGKSVFTRLQGCFFVRGNLLLLDTTVTASSQDFDPMEAFSFTATAATFEAVRFDDSRDWDYRFCPYLTTPWGFCDPLRDWNEIYYPALSLSQKASVLGEALLIRKQFNFTSTTSESFGAKWNTLFQQGMVERMREDYRYDVQAIVDTPRFIDQSIFQFIRGERPTIPDMSSSTMPPVCYPERRQVTLADGSASVIFGQVCYFDREYRFQ